ncbi:cytidine deaminase 1-like [Raphanus sativus]|uniref:Cytidine deaminase 1-like n=1 Tax=Raphanus sativus TaxID=3726 RepID=A0A6J0LKG0_RAPSA|nr:cytidine deaminase 1-like [Raphanus sativus]
MNPSDPFLSKLDSVRSRCPSGVALVDCEGRVYRGWYIESTAYNSSLGPVQAMLVDFVANGGGGGFERIVGAVLVEKKDAVVLQEHTAGYSSEM